MRHPAPTPSGPAFPLPRASSNRRRHQAGTVELAREAVEKFNALLHQLCIDAPRIDSDAIASVARWLDSQPADRRDALLQSRLGRLAELEAMRVDPHWPLDPAQEHRIQALQSYVTRDDDLIPDSVPLYGRLDDALLLELAWPVFAEDVDDYRDFCRYREEAAARFERPVEQSDWLRARAEEGALWEQLHRVHDQPFIEHEAPAAFFRVR